MDDPCWVAIVRHAHAAHAHGGCNERTAKAKKASKHSHPSRVFSLHIKPKNEAAPQAAMLT